MRQTKTRGIALTASELQLLAVAHRETALTLLWLARRALNGLDADSEDPPDTELDQSTAVRLGILWGKAEQVYIDKINGGLDKTTGEFLCLIRVLSDLHTRLMQDSEAAMRAAMSVKPGRPAKTRNRLMEIGQRKPTPGRPLRVDVTDEALLQISEIAINNGRTQVDALRHLVRSYRQADGKHTAGREFQAEVKNLQKRLAKLRSRIRK